MWPNFKLCVPILLLFICAKAEHEKKTNETGCHNCTSLKNVICTNKNENFPGRNYFSYIRCMDKDGVLIPMKFCCARGQYYDASKKKCIAIPGGGSVVYAEYNGVCKDNHRGILVHPTQKQFYYICKDDAVLVAKCPNLKVYDPKQKYCIDVDTECSITIYDESHGEVIAPLCKNSGRFGVPGRSNYFYMCTMDGDKSYRSIYKCPIGTYYDTEYQMCIKRHETTTMSSTTLGWYLESDPYPPCVKPGRFRSAMNNSLYYICSAKTNDTFYQTRLSCPDGMLFSEENLCCISASEANTKSTHSSSGDIDNDDETTDTNDYETENQTQVSKDMDDLNEGENKNVTLTTRFASSREDGEENDIDGYDTSTVPGLDKKSTLSVDNEEESTDSYDDEVIVVVANLTEGMEEDSSGNDDDYKNNNATSKIDSDKNIIDDEEISTPSNDNAIDNKETSTVPAFNKKSTPSVDNNEESTESYDDEVILVVANVTEGAEEDSSGNDEDYKIINTTSKIDSNENIIDDEDTSTPSNGNALNVEETSTVPAINKKSTPSVDINEESTDSYDDEVILVVANLTEGAEEDSSGNDEDYKNINTTSKIDSNENIIDDEDTSTPSNENALNVEETSTVPALNKKSTPSVDNNEESTDSYDDEVILVVANITEGAEEDSSGNDEDYKNINTTSKIDSNENIIDDEDTSTPSNENALNVEETSTVPALNKKSTPSVDNNEESTDSYDDEVILVVANITEGAEEDSSGNDEDYKNINTTSKIDSNGNIIDDEDTSTPSNENALNVEETSTVPALNKKSTPSVDNNEEFTDSQDYEVKVIVANLTESNEEDLSGNDDDYKNSSTTPKMDSNENNIDDEDTSTPSYPNEVLTTGANNDEESTDSYDFETVANQTQASKDKSDLSGRDENRNITFTTRFTSSKEDSKENGEESSTVPGLHKKSTPSVDNKEESTDSYDDEVKVVVANLTEGMKEDSSGNDDDYTNNTTIKEDSDTSTASYPNETLTSVNINDESTDSYDSEVAVDVANPTEGIEDDSKTNKATSKKDSTENSSTVSQIKQDSTTSEHDEFTESHDYVVSIKNTDSSTLFDLLTTIPSTIEYSSPSPSVTDPYDFEIVYVDVDENSTGKYDNFDDYLEDSKTTTTTIATTTTDKDVECSTEVNLFENSNIICVKEGAFSFNNSCHQYYECKWNEDGKLVPSMLECPKCLRFNENVGYCDLPQNVPKCLKLLSNLDTICYSAGNFSIPGICHQYKECVLVENGRYEAKLHVCADSKNFNNVTKTCDASTRCESKTKPTCRVAGTFPNSDSCVEFYQCIGVANSTELTYKQFSCPPGLVYNESIGACDLPKNVQWCSNIYNKN